MIAALTRLSTPIAVADVRQRNFMAAEFYGKEYVLFEGGMLNNAEGEQRQDMQLCCMGAGQCHAVGPVLIGTSTS